MNKLYKKDKWLSIVGKEPSTMDELFEGVVKVVQHGLRHTRRPAYLCYFAWDLTYRDCVSNTHDAPMTGVRNWESDPSKPKGYPGYYGRVWATFSNDPGDFSDAIFGATLTYTGTGGYGNYNSPFPHHEKGELYPVSYDYRLFLDDWPLVFQSIGKKRTLSKLKDDNFYNTYRKVWSEKADVILDRINKK